MVHLTPVQAGDQLCSIPIAIGLFVSVSALVALCAKHSRKVSKKYFTETNDSTTTTTTTNIAPRSPLRTVPKQLITKISNKAIPFMYQRKACDEAEMGSKSEEEKDEEFGEVGLWQKAILMGEKCQPPEFSGVIYYDCGGKQIPEMPKSPRATSPLPSFSFPVVKHAS